MTVVVLENVDQEYLDCDAIGHTDLLVEKAALVLQLLE
jgi:hypothetical protein